MGQKEKFILKENWESKRKIEKGGWKERWDKLQGKQKKEKMISIKIIKGGIIINGEKRYWKIKNERKEKDLKGKDSFAD